jgi:hypothetical protein
MRVDVAAVVTLPVQGVPVLKVLFVDISVTRLRLAMAAKCLAFDLFQFLLELVVIPHLVSEIGSEEVDYKPPGYFVRELVVPVTDFERVAEFASAVNPDITFFFVPVHDFRLSHCRSSTSRL